MPTEKECRPCSLAVEAEDSALRLLDDAIELVLTVLTASENCSSRDGVEQDPITRLSITLRKDVVGLAHELQRRLLAYVTIIANERRERQLCLPFHGEAPY